MRVLLSTYDSRGGVEPLVALGVRLQELGAEALVCAPPDCAERLAEVGVPLMPAGEPVRALVHGTKPPSADDVPRLTAELIATWFDKVAAAADGCDALVASGVIPAAAGARSVAEKLGLHSVHVSYCPIFLPSPHHRPQPLPGQPLPPDVTDNQVLWELNAQGYNAVFGPALNAHRVANGLPPVDNIRHYLYGDHPWLAADPVLAPVVPQWADQPYFASRVAGLGIGAAHDVRTPTTESLSAALGTALTPETRARATAVAGTIRTDGATVAAKLLLDAVSRPRPPALRLPGAGF
jgi:UDP:flavonoid glycosyltransferase YjiC (YdhE family)